MKKTVQCIFTSAFALILVFMFTEMTAYAGKSSKHKHSSSHSSSKAKTSSKSKSKSSSKSKSRSRSGKSKEKRTPIPGTPAITTVLNQLEKRYDVPSFSAHFTQESPLPDIQVTETAEGQVYFKKPGKFRWEYKKPQVLNYISNGDTLWIHSPSDNNVWIGKSKEFFGKGSSANVLTDVKQIRTQFDVSLADTTDPDLIRLKLVPKNKSIGFTDIFLSIDRETYDIHKITSFNMNGEETRIILTDLKFQDTGEDSQFNFTVPPKANVIPME